MFMLKRMRPVPFTQVFFAGLLFSAASLNAVSAQADSAANRPTPMGKALDGSMIIQFAPNIFPNGQGLPSGIGLAQNGAGLYQAQCASCHGKKGEGGTAQELIGGDGPLSAPDADKTIRTYWPFATTLFDTIARSMPPAAPGHLSADALYSLCAYLLAENGLWGWEQPMGPKELAAIVMPNRNGFIRKFP
jgi:cytochrome c